MAKRTKRDEADRVLREIVRDTPITDFLEPQTYLGRLYQKAKARIVDYSYLKFAGDLGFAETNILRLIIASERVLTPKMGRRLGQSLKLTGTTLRYWTVMVAYQYERSSVERDLHLRELLALKSKLMPKSLSPTLAAYFDQWYHPVIREMTGLPDFVGDPQWIQTRLAFPLRLDEIKRSLEVLVDLGLVEKDPITGKFAKTQEVQTGSDIDSIALVRFHQSMIEAGRDSITRIDEDRRDIEAVTVSLPHHAIAQIKAKIAVLTQEVLALETAYAKNGDPPGPVDSENEVYQLNIQLFPFTSKRGTP